MQPVGYVSNSGRRPGDPHGFVVFDSGAAVDAKLFQHLSKQHPGATWHQKARQTTDSATAPRQIVLKNARGESVGVVMPHIVERNAKAFADKVAAGHRPAPAAR